MSKTTNLGLTLVDTANEAATTFQEWQRNINTNGSGNELSDFQKIDAFAGAIYGVSGNVTLAASSWNDLVYTLTVNDLGDTDAIFFSPADAASKKSMEEASCFVAASGSVVTFTATIAPTEDIILNYFISRGK